jgi:hypothetical protein
VKGFAQAIVAIAITVGISIIAVNTIMPIINEEKSMQSFQESKNSLSTIDEAVRQMLLESVGSRRQIDIDVRSGRLVVAGDEDKIKIQMEGYKLADPGTTIQEGDIQIRTSGLVDAAEQDIDGDGNIDLVLNNSLVSFAVRKIGNITNWSSIDTSSIITQIMNRRTNTTIMPTSGIMINDKAGTSLGTGYTTLTETGINIPSASILVFMNSTSGTQYEALFTLSPATDFVELEIKNLKNA